MGEFARVLSEIIEHGKQEKAFTLKELAQHAQITSSYLSSLKHSNRKPPAHKTLVKLTDALRNLEVADTEVQRLVDAYNRQHLNYQDDRNSLLASLIDEYKEDGNLFERLKQGVQTKGMVLRRQNEKPTRLEPDLLHTGFIEGDHHAFILQAINLLKKAQDSESTGGSIYITWFHHDLLDESFNRDREELRDMLRSFLWVDSPFRVLHLWAGDIAKEITVILDFLIQYIGTSNCFLYEIPYGQHLPEYLVVEGVGFIEARPVPDNRYWMRSVLVDEHTTPSDELDILVQYLEFLLGPPKTRKTLVQTNASPGKFSVSPGLKKLIEVERESVKLEQLLIKSIFSAKYRPIELVRTILEASGLPRNRIEMVVRHQQERVTTREERLEYGKDRSIHEREFLKKEFQRIFKNLSRPSSTGNRRYALEAELLKSQIIGVLRAIKRNPNFHFALADQEFLVQFTLTGDTAFLSFDPPDAQHELPFRRDDLLARAWTDHPDVVYQLRHEFYARWKAIDPARRTDTEQGRQNVIDFLIAEPLKALLDVDLPGRDLWPFMYQLVDYAAYLDAESFIREVYTHEQVAEEIFILNNHFPLITMPDDIGPWEPRSSIRTRQILLQALLRKIRHIRLIIPQQACEAYWETGQYDGAYTFNRSWLAQHFSYLSNLLLEFPEKISLELIRQNEPFPVNIEVISGEWVLLQKNEIVNDQQGVILHDKQLAARLLAYVDRNLLAQRSTELTDPQQMISWFQERIDENS
jgi:transcriptional regulator with XRE-family HTH domain